MNAGRIGPKPPILISWVPDSIEKKFSKVVGRNLGIMLGGLVYSQMHQEARGMGPMRRPQRCIRRSA